jgi:hypothetical protein
MTKLSDFFNKFDITLILDDIFEPPIIQVTGLFSIFYYQPN